MDGPGNELLPGATLTANEHRGRAGLGDPPNRVEDLTHRGGFANDPVEAKAVIELLMERGVFNLQMPRAEGLFDLQLEEVDFHAALGNVIIGPALHRLNDGLVGPIRGHEDADRGSGMGLRAIDEPKAILLGQPEIGQQHVEFLPFEQFGCGGGIVGDIHIEPILQGITQPLARCLFVVDDEQTGLAHEAGCGRSRTWGGPGIQT